MLFTDSYFINQPQKKEKDMDKQGSFCETAKNTGISGEVTGKTIEYEGLLNYEEYKAFLRTCFMLLCPGSITTISIDSPESNSALYHFTISSDLSNLENDFGPNGVFQRCMWHKKFHRVIVTSAQVREEKINIVTLPNGSTLSFENGRWWINIKNADLEKQECFRHEAESILQINGLTGVITDEARADAIKPDQPLLEF